MKRWRIALLILILLADAILILAYIAERGKSDLDRSVDAITSPYQFNLAAWEARNLLGNIVSQSTPEQELSKEGEIALVKRYFSSADLDEKSKLKGRVEKILGAQIAKVLEEEGIAWRVFFPPLSFKIDSPPKLLVISQRGKIGVEKQILLSPGLKEKDIKKIKEELDKLNVSSAVVMVGGLATYPTLVQEDESMRGVLRLVAHEWIHHYLFFKPLGFRYTLQFLAGKSYQDLTTINETVATMVGDEIGDTVYFKYYAEKPKKEESGFQKREPSGLDSMMSDIRKTVNNLLAEGKIDEAESYMQGHLKFLQDKDSGVRELNQAYFAFYDVYNDNHNSSDTVGEELSKLRESSRSLKDFLWRAQVVWDSEDFRKIKSE